MKNWVLFFLGFLFILSCVKKPKVYSEELFEISGVVYSESKNAMPFVDVFLYSKFDTLISKTNFDGEFKFEKLNLKSYFVIVNFVGYSKFDSSIFIKNKNQRVDINLIVDTSNFNNDEPFGFNKSVAEYDIIKDNVRLLFPGGIGGVSLRSFDRDFEKKYNLELINPGCTKFPWDNYSEYNNEMFKHLDSIYGLDWRNEVSTEIVGINEYLKKEKAPTLSITAINLSEDMSTLSTKNDEIFVFIYDYSDTNELNAPLVSRKFIFYKDYMEHSFSIPNKDNLILFFIEEDSFRESIELEPIVRIYFKELLKANSYDEVEKYLGVDDLLGTQVINSNTSTFTISGRSSLDKYEYSFEVK